MHDGGPSLVDLTAHRPALLLAYARAMLRKCPEHMPSVDPRVFADLDAALRRLGRCSCAHCHVPAAAALAFWWICMHHDGTRRLVAACEPPRSRWRQPDELERLFKFVGAHVLRIKTSPKTPETVAQLVQVFQTSMYVVLSRQGPYADAMMDADRRESTQKRTKAEKAELCALFGNSVVHTYALPPQAGYLAAGCHWVAKGKKRTTAPRKRAAATAGKAAAQVAPAWQLPTAALSDSDDDDIDVMLMDDGTSYL
jgi:hypothetical protein